MPKRKRTGVAAGAGDAGGDSSLHWQWEADGSVWTSFDKAANETLNQAFSNKKNDVTITIGGGNKAKILFEKSVQKNIKTGWERRVRCCLKSTSESDAFVWEWQDEHLKWNPYNASVSLRLDEVHRGHSSGDVTFEAYRRSYTVDVSKMEQTNDTTGVIRKVRRTKLDVPKVKDEVEEEPVAPAKVSKRGAASKRGASAAAAATAEDEEEEPVSKETVAKGSSGRKSKSTKAASAKSEEGEKVKTLLLKGKAPVDPECTAKVGKAHVYSERNDIYDTMLNQTNIGNNNNKFYLIQLLEDDNKKLYSVWLRWGRVGKTGQTNLVSCGPALDEAKKIFCSKFYDKTRNDWSSRKKFVKVSGKYDMVQIDYNADSKDEVDTPEKPIDIPDSKLDKRIQDLINLICDVKSMEAAVKEMKFDAKRAPLGKLTESQIKAGYAALKIIDNCVQTGNFGQVLTDACSTFYTRIPHDFGMQRPPTIRTKAEVKAKLQLLEALSDIEVAMKIISEVKTSENPVDTHYKSLSCSLTPIDKNKDDFALIEDYLQNTHAATHNQYKMEILNAFCIQKPGEKENFVDHGNRQLLWHGSRLTNWVGILSQRLRIAPPEAPVTGYMFGKGVYFADMSSKSANYCFATKSQNVGLVLLCEVSLGTCNQLLSADYAADKLPSGKHSVKGMGKIAPDPKGSFKMSDGTVVPMGQSHDTGVTNPSGYTLNYNEFIVYNTNQVKMRYLVQVKFNFK